jgi:cytochrome bd-type quinol oxidase subunit 2
MENSLKEFRKNNEDNLEKGQEHFEKQLSFISAGALGISMFLIEKVVKDLSQSQYKWILIASWIALGLTLIINLISHFFSVKFNYSNIEEIDTKNYDQLKSIRRNQIMKGMNVFTLITLIFGIIFLVLFMSLNI